MNDGGAIVWVSNRITVDSSNVFANNFAPYGANIGSYPKMIRIEFLDNNDYLNHFTN